MKKEPGRRSRGLALARWGGMSLALATTPVSWAGDGVVRAVLFSSPTCPHCQKVREEVLPALGDRFPGRLQVAVLSTATPSGRDLYWSAFRRYGVEQRGVPLLVVGDFALVGSVEIPERLPALVESYLAKGGVDWPPLPGLAAVLAASAPAPTPPPAPMPTPEAPVVATAADPAASAGLEPRPAPEPEPTPASLEPAAAPTPREADGSTPPALAPRTTRPQPTPVRPQATTPLASPETATTETRMAEPLTVAPPLLRAIDGRREVPGALDRFRADPQGNALAVLVLVGMVAIVLRSVAALRRSAPATPTSRFDWLTPVLALAGLGVSAYLAHVEVREVEAILVAWGVRRWKAGPAASWAAVALLAMTGLGTLFSIYLTFLEPFVIGATCLWCLSSAVIMTTLYGLAHVPGRAAAAELRLRPSLGFSRQSD